MNDKVIPLEKLGKRGTVRVYTQSYVEQLKEENAELKEKLNFSTQYYQGEKAKEHLTKAKELLTRFVMASVYFNGKETDLIKEAEQFLKEGE